MFAFATDAYQRREQSCATVGVSADAARANTQRRLTKQPDYLDHAGELRDYQLDGLNWLIYAW